MGDTRSLHTADEPAHDSNNPAARQIPKDDRPAGKPNNKPMKKTILSLAIAVAALATLQAGETTTTTTTTTTGMGTITEFSPGKTFVLKESEGPVTYNYGDSVTYVTKTGKVLTADEVKSRIRVGLPVSVGYTTKGTDRVISRIEIEDD